MSGSNKKLKANITPPQTATAGWIMTFADLMSLLMAFFVMLLASAKMDVAKFEEMGKSMKLALGAHVQQLTSFTSEEMKPFKEMEAKAKQKIDQTKKDAQELAEVLQEQIKDASIEIDTHGRIIIIRMMASGLFKSGKSEIKDSFRPVLMKLGAKLDEIKGDIVVSGHADDIPIETERYRSNWELSASRAYSVIEELLENTDVLSERFVLRGFGDTRPRVPNNSEENRAKNRRVEILIDQRDPVSEKVEFENGQGLNDMKMTDAPIPKDVENPQVSSKEPMIFAGKQ